MKLSQQEADILLQIEKLLLEPAKVSVPLQGVTTSHKLTDTGKKENFNMLLRHGKKNPNKISYQLMYHGNIILLRLDTEAGAHYNPDGTFIPAHTPHLHIYTEEYDDHMAYLLPDGFTDVSDLVNLLREFLVYSKVINVDEVNITIQGGLFDEPPGTNLG